MDEPIICGKGDVLDRIEAEIAKIRTSLAEVREKIFNGISTDVPLIKRALERLDRRLAKLEVKEVPADSNKRPKLPRLLGTVIIVAVFAVVSVITFVVVVRVGLLDPEMLGKFMGGVLEKF